MLTNHNVFVTITQVMVPELFDDHMLDVKDLMKEELMLL